MAKGYSLTTKNNVRNPEAEDSRFLFFKEIVNSKPKTRCIRIVRVTMSFFSKALLCYLEVIIETQI